MSTGSKTIADLPEVEVLDEKDQFLFFQNSSKKTKKITRKNLAISRGFGTSITGVVTNDGTPPNIPTGLTVTTAVEIDRDGTEKVYIRASITANTESDLDSYGWSIRRVSGIPVFNGGGVLTGYGGTTQIFDAVTNISPAATGTKMQWDVRSNVWYEVRVCSIDKTGNASSYTPLTSSNVIQSSKDTTAPAAPTSVVATSAIKSVFLSWINSTDADLAFVKIYRNTTNTPPTIGTTTAYARIMSNSYVDSNTIQGTTYYYWLTSVDDSANETATTSTVVSIQPGLVANTDITTFAVDATKMTTNIIILKADASWTDNSPSAGYIAWNAHTLVYGGASYSINAGNTNLQFVYWTGGTTYSTSNTNPTLTDGQFMIATNAKDISGNPTGIHDLAWNAIANAVIGSAYIQNAAITNAKVNDLAVDKLTSGSISAQTISLIGDSIIKSSSATSIDAGSGLWIKGLAGGGSEFGIGDLAATNYGYLKWKTGTNSLEIKGSIKATSGYFGNSTSAAEIDSTGIVIGTAGRIQSSGLTWTNSGGKGTFGGSTGFFLGYTAGSANAYQFFIGNASGNYMRWNGSNLSFSGQLTGTTSDGGDAEAGLVITSGFGIRYGDDASVLTINGGNGNGTEFGAQLDLIGSNFTGAGGAAQGQLSLSAGYLASGFTDTYDGSIVFRTSLGSYGSGTSNYIGIRRIIVERDGTVTIGRKSDSVIGPNSGSGVLIVETSIKSPYIYFGSGDYTSMSITNNFGSNNSLTFAGGTGDVESSAFRWVNSGNSTKLASLSTSGVLTATSFVSSSSKRFKKKIKKFKGGLDILEKLNPITFDWKKIDIKEDIGLIAEEVDKILPVIVKHNNKNEAEGLDYSKLTVVLINAVKELSAEVKELKKKLKDANAN